MPDPSQCAVDEIKHGLRRAEAAIQPQFQQFARSMTGLQHACVSRRIVHLRTHPFGRLAKILRAGALKAENRLLVIAHHEQRTHLLGVLAQPRPELLGHGEDDVPLLLVSVLRFVHQNVIELPVKLVADPVRLLLVLQKRGSAADLIVEIDQSLALLGLVPGQRKGTAQPQRGHQMIDQIEHRPQRAHGLDAAHHPRHIFGIGRVDLVLRLASPELAFLGEENPGQGIDRISALDRCSQQPFADPINDSQSHLGAPFVVHFQAAPQGSHIERIVLAHVRQLVPVGIGRQSQQPQHIAAHIARLPAARPEPDRPRRRAA